MPGASQQSSSSGDLLPEMMESDTPSPATFPNRGDDTEVSSRRAPPEHQVVQEAKKVLPEGGAFVTRGSGIKTRVPESSGLQPETILEISKWDPSREGRTSAAVSEDQRLPEPLTDLLRPASLSKSTVL